jgi:DNA-binding transcriptional MerR regulator
MPPPTRKNGKRYYEAQAVDDLMILRFYRKAGIPIRGLASITKHRPGTGTRRDVWVDVLNARINDLDSWIENAVRTRALLEQSIECRCNGKRDDCTVLQAAKAQNPIA